MRAPRTPLAIATLIGRTNCGKSRLFNALCNRPEALVSNQENLTRDWRETPVQLGGHRLLLRDTAGLAEGKDELSQLVRRRTLEQIDSADVLLFVVDARAGLLPADLEYATLLRRSGKPVALVINKIDTVAGRRGWGEFTELGFEHSACISAERHEGLAELGDAVAAALAQAPDDPSASAAKLSWDHAGEAPGLVVCGMANSGKSTLINRLKKSERLLVHSMAGTTREPIGQHLRLGSRDYTIYDTCGFVRQGDVLQYLADSKTKRLVANADLVIYLIDGTRGLVRGDLRKLSELLEAGQNPLVACNKADLLDDERSAMLGEEAIRQLAKLGLESPPLLISAQQSTGLRSLRRALEGLHRELNASFATNRLTRILNQATRRRPPPTIDSRRIRLRYAHQGGSKPLTIVIHGKQTRQLSRSYQRYLAKVFRDELNLRRSIPRIVLSTDDNPYARPLRAS